MNIDFEAFSLLSVIIVLAEDACYDPTKWSLKVQVSIKAQAVLIASSVACVSRETC